jgi:hypothetical protein
MDDRLNPAKGGNFWKGIAIGLGCQAAYLLFVDNIHSSEIRLIGFVLFALAQYTYLYPLALFFQRRRQGRTSNGLMFVGVVSLIAAVVWFGYSLMHGAFSSITI